MQALHVVLRQSQNDKTRRQFKRLETNWRHAGVDAQVPLRGKYI